MSNISEQELRAAIKEVYDREGMHIEVKNLNEYFSCDDLCKLTWKDVYDAIYDHIVVH